MISRLLQVTGLLALALAFAGCSDDPEKPAEPKPAVLTFLAAPDSIEKGQSSTLSWKTENASKVVITENGEPLSLSGIRADEGTVDVRPSIDSSYVLTATGESGEATATVTVMVAQPPEAPAIASFSADPATIGAGEKSRLSWTTTGAEALVIKDQIGNALDLAGADIANGSVEVSPKGDMVYTLTVTNKGGTASAQTTVDLTSAPKVSFNGPTGAVEPGAAAKLSWSVTNATSVTITDAGGTPVHQSTSTFSGELTVNLDYSDRFFLTATGIGGETSAMAEVNVQPVIDRFEITTPGPVRAGDEVSLVWATRGATHVIVDQPGKQIAAVEVPEATNGTATARVGVDGSFSISARSGALIATASDTIELTPVPYITSFTVDRTQVTARPDLPATVTLSWHIDGAQRLLIEQSTGGYVNLVGTSARGDSVDVQLTDDTTYTLHAINEHGETLAVPVMVDVLPAARIVSFDARPLRVGSGDDVHLSWETQDAVAIRIEKDGVDVTANAGVLNGSQTHAVVADGTYVLKAIDVLGIEQTSEPFAVTVGAPIITSFTTDRSTITAGTNLTFSWENVGGTSLEILDEGGGSTGCSTTSLFEIPMGECVFTLPMIDDTITYTLRVTNDAGQTTTAQVDVVIVGGPVIQSFTVDRAISSTGDSLVFTWAVDNDAMGVTPTLHLSDSLGNDYPEISAAGVDPNNGTVTVVLPDTAAGATSFTLLAETAGTTPSTMSVNSNVYGLPTVSSLTATPEEIDTQFGTVPSSSTLSWTTQWGVSAEIYLLDASGNWVLPAVYTTSDAGVVASGNTVVSPAGGVQTYEIDLVNAAGVHGSATVSVYVDIPAVTIAASQSAILAGESVDISWTTARATEATVMPPLVSSPNNAFIDVSGSSTAVQMSRSSGSDDDGFGVVTFPAGFSFPFGGVDRTSARVITNGYVSFDMNSTANEYSNTVLPNSSEPDVHLAPFWDDLGFAAHAPNTQVWSDLGTDPTNGDYLVIQWKNNHFLSSDSGSPSDLNFEVVLWENGNFEYRYGTMSSSGSSTSTAQARADGDSATIGFQTPDRSSAFLVNRNTAITGGLSNKSFSFEVVAATGSGSRTYSPTTSTTYTIVGSNSHSSSSASVAVTVHPLATVGTPTISPAEPEINTPFTLAWTSTNATSVEVLDASNNVRCTAGAGQLASGSCDLTETAVGAYTYTVRVVGQLPHDVTTTTVGTTVYNPIAITSFTASSTLVPVGGTTTLTWQTVGAATLALSGDGQAIDVTGKSIGSDSITLSPSEPTTYTLTITDSGRTRTATVEVLVRTTSVDSFTATSQQIPAGGSTTLSWTTTDAQVVDGLPVEVAELTGATFIDASANSGTTATQLTPSDTDDGSVTYTFPSGFTFPFDGAERSAIRIFTNGFASFATSSSSTNASNANLPATGSSNVHLAPFWDDLHTQGTGEIWVDTGTDASGDYLVVQWKNYQFYDSSNPSVLNPSDLDFEIVLYENGSFDYRYGAMTGLDSARSNGSGATLGYQTLNSASSLVISYNTALTPSLANRSWRFSLPADGSRTVSPAQTTTYTICASNAGYRECREVTVVVVRAGDVMIGELMANPGSPLTDPDAEWFEIRNASPHALDLDGWVIASGSSETHTINNGGPLVVQPGATLTLARSGSSGNGGFTPGYVYGSSLSFDHTASDSVSITFGATQIDTVSWDSTWTFPAGATLSLDPSYYTRDATKNDVPANWCTSTASYTTSHNGSPGTVGNGCRSPDYDMDVLGGGMQFIDISTSANATALSTVASGVGSQTVTGGIGFTMPFYGGTVSDLWVSANGVLGFTLSSSGSHSGNANMPSSSTPNGGLVAAFWDDIDPNSGVGSAQTELRTVGSRQVRIVQWTNFKVSGGSGNITVQVQLWDDGDIVVSFADASSSGSASQVNATSGSGATIAGIENTGGTAGLVASFNTAGAAYPGRTVYFNKK